MAPHGAPPGGAGGLPPNGSDRGPKFKYGNGEIDAFARLEQGVTGLEKVISSATQARKGLSEGIFALRRGFEKMRAELDGERARRSELEERLAHATDGFVHEEKLAKLGEEHAAQVASARRETEEARSEARAQEREAAVLRRELEHKFANSAEALEVATKLSKLCDNLGEELGAVLGAIRSLSEALAPVVGSDSDAGRAVSKAMEGAELSSELMAELDISRSELFEIMNAGIEDAADAEVYLPSNIPPLSVDSLAVVPRISRDKEVVDLIFRRLQTMFSNMKRERNVERLEAFFDAYQVMQNAGRIDGRERFLKGVVSALTDRTQTDMEARGKFYELVRLAGMVEAGRKIDTINRDIPNVDYDGWRDEGHQVAMERLSSPAEVDAIGEGRLIEVKTVWFGGRFGTYLSEMFKYDGLRDIAIIKTIEDPNNGISHIGHAVKIANQLIKYRELMKAGMGEILELHVTSHDPIPQDVIDAMHSFFGKGRLEVVWYDDIISHNGRTLEPTEGLFDVPEPAPEAEEASSADTADETPTIVPEPAEEELGEIDLESMDHVGDQNRIEIEVGELIEEQDEEEEPDDRDAAAALFYGRGLMSLLDHDADRSEEFLDWLVEEGHWAADIVGNDSDGMTATVRERVAQWLEVEAQENAAAMQNPWDAIDDDKAGKKFNALLSEVRAKDAALDWNRPRTQGIQNVDVVQVLVWIMKLPIARINAEVRLHEEIGDFIAYMRERYQSGMSSYFQTARDGPRLLDIMKRYCWVLDNS